MIRVLSVAALCGAMTTTVWADSIHQHTSAACAQAQQPAQHVALAVEIQDGPPDYCFTASAGELHQHRECRTVVRVRR